MENKCVCCGAEIPEGRMVCPSCEDIQLGEKHICPIVCDGRSETCHGKCERFVRHTELLNADYEKRSRRAEAASSAYAIHAAGFKKQKSDLNTLRKRVR